MHRHSAIRHDLAAGWREETDPKSGHSYYVDTATGESTWTMPVSKERRSKKHAKKKKKKTKTKRQRRRSSSSSSCSRSSEDFADDATVYVADDTSEVKRGQDPTVRPAGMKL